MITATTALDWGEQAKEPSTCNCAMRRPCDRHLAGQQTARGLVLCISKLYRRNTDVAPKSSTKAAGRSIADTARDFVNTEVLVQEVLRDGHAPRHQVVHRCGT